MRWRHAVATAGVSCVEEGEHVFNPEQSKHTRSVQHRGPRIGVRTMLFRCFFLLVHASSLLACLSWLVVSLLDVSICCWSVSDLCLFLSHLTCFGRRSTRAQRRVLSLWHRHETPLQPVLQLEPVFVDEAGIQRCLVQPWTPTSTGAEHAKDTPRGRGAVRGGHGRGDRSL